MPGLRSANTRCDPRVGLRVSSDIRGGAHNYTSLKQGVRREVFGNLNFVPHDFFLFVRVLLTATTAAHLRLSRAAWGELQRRRPLPAGFCAHTRCRPPTYFALTNSTLKPFDYWSPNRQPLLQNEPVQKILTTLREAPAHENYRPAGGWQCLCLSGPCRQ